MGSKRNRKPYTANLVREAVAAGTWAPPTDAEMREHEAKRTELRKAVAATKRENNNA